MSCSHIWEAGRTDFENTCKKCGNTQLRRPIALLVELDRLRAGIESLRNRLESGNSIPVRRLVLDEDDCARLRALLESKP